MVRRFAPFLLLLPAVLLVYGFLIEPNRLVVREVFLPSERLDRFFGDAVVVHLSDLHLTGIGFREKRLLRALERIRPDYVFVTGDYIGARRPYGPVLDLLGRLDPIVGVYGVLGNVDYNGTRESCRICHEGGPGGPLRGPEPIRVLRNESALLERNGKTLLLIGLDEFDTRPERPDPRRLLEESERATPRIVLSHTTAWVGEAAACGADLYLAGDTHGGQAALPAGLFRRIMPEKHWEYRDGRFRVGSLWLHVHHGIGWSILPFRLGYPPLVAVLRFREEP
ncbi:MAG: metallophosphoesterase [Candidatus Eisenbacteria bacterium]